MLCRPASTVSRSQVLVSRFNQSRKSSALQNYQMTFHTLKNKKTKQKTKNTTKKNTKKHSNNKTQQQQQNRTSTKKKKKKMMYKPNTKLLFFFRAQTESESDTNDNMSNYQLPNIGIVSGTAASNTSVNTRTLECNVSKNNRRAYPVMPNRLQPNTPGGRGYLISHPFLESQAFAISFFSFSLF